MVLTGTRRLLEVPIQPSVGGTAMARLCPIQLLAAATLLCSEFGFTPVAIFDTATGLAVIPTTGTCSQIRRPESPATIALECPQPASTMGLASLLVPTARCRPLVRTGNLIVLVAGLAILDCDAGASGLPFEPTGPVTEVRVSTTLLPV